MRLSRSATVPQTVDLYVLADHRMDPNAAPVPGALPMLEYAGRVDERTSAPALAPFLARGTFLTRWSDFIAQPEKIDGDYVFAQSDTDADFQKVVYVTRQRGDVTGLLILGALGAGALTTTVLLVLLAIRRTRRTA